MLEARSSDADINTGIRFFVFTMFTFDGIKIDQSFVQEIGKNIDKKEYEIVNFMLTLAKKLELFVAAEAVETIEQLDVLGNLGCNEIQGYFLSRPQPLEQLAEAAFTAKNKLLESKKEIVERRTGRGQANYSGKTTLINEMNLLEKIRKPTRTLTVLKEL